MFQLVGPQKDYQNVKLTEIINWKLQTDIEFFLQYPQSLTSYQFPDYLAEGQDGSPAPAVHHEDAEDVAGNLNEDAQEEVGVGITREAGGGEREAVIAHRHTEPLE